MALFLSLSLQKIGSSKKFRLDDSRLWLDCTTCMYDSYNAYTWLITCMGYSYTLYVWLIILWEFWFVDMVFNCNLLCQIKGTFWNSSNSCDGLVLKSGLSFNIIQFVHHRVCKQLKWERRLKIYQLLQSYTRKHKLYM